MWEGGTRSHTIFVYPKRVVDPGRTWDGLFHVTDWYPTLYRAAGGASAAKVQFAWMQFISAHLTSVQITPVRFSSQYLVHSTSVHFTSFS